MAFKSLKPGGIFIHARGTLTTQAIELNLPGLSLLTSRLLIHLHRLKVAEDAGENSTLPNPVQS